MAVVYFKRRTNSTVAASELSNMSADTVYFLTSGSKPYMFFSGDSIAASANPHYALGAVASDNKTYTLGKPYGFAPVYGMTVNVQFGSTNTSSEPTLDGVKICRRLSNSLSPITINASELTINTSYRLVYTKIGAIDYWVISSEKPAWSDLYGKPSNLLSYQIVTSSSQVGSTAGTAYLILE